MEKLLETQLNRTKVLMDALEVVKIVDNPEAQQKILEITRCVKESQTLLDKLKKIATRKKEISEEMAKLARKCDALSQWSEKINATVFPNNSINTSTPSKDESQLKNSEQSSSGLEISPCPASWNNGALATPQPGTSRGHQNGNKTSSTEDQFPRIKPLQASEMENVPPYMKGRLTCENLNTFIDTLNGVLKQKYSVVLLPRKDVKRKDLVLYCEWKSQEQEFAVCGKAFFTTDDLLNLAQQKLDKITDKMIQILRHTNRLRQTRAKKNVVVYSVI